MESSGGGAGKQWPDYYERIEHPIALKRIKRKIQDAEYTHVDQFLADIKLMCTNAQTYNQEGSPIYVDSQMIDEKAVSMYDSLKAKKKSRLKRRAKVAAEAQEEARHSPPPYF